jgi:hypothetical protein
VPRIADRVGLNPLHEAHAGFLVVHDGLAVVHERKREQLDLVLGTVGARLAPVVPCKVTRQGRDGLGYLQFGSGVKKAQR